MRIPVTLMAACLVATSAWGDTAAEPAQSDANVLARVGDRIITFSQLNTQLNSTAVVGLSTPPWVRPKGAPSC